MDVGYLPDMFGHIAQMPQILRLAGFADTVVWRGVPSAITKTGFFWEAPDGSTVRAEYLPVGYGNGAALPDDAKALVQRTADHRRRDRRVSLIDDLLCMNGSDHLMPQPGLGRVVAEANDLQDDFFFEVTSLPRYLATAPTEGLERWKGELRSGFRANMLMGVTSNRVDVKRMGELAERAAGATGRTPGRAVPGAVGVAAAAARSGLEGDRAQLRPRLDLRLLGRRRRRRRPAPLRRGADHRHRPGGPGHQVVGPVAGRAGPLRAQPGPADPVGVVELVVGAAEPPSADVQVLSERTGPPGSMVLDADTVRTVLGMLQGPQIDNDAWVHDMVVEEDEEGIDITVSVGPDERHNVPIAAGQAGHLHPHGGPARGRGPHRPRTSRPSGASWPGWRRSRATAGSRSNRCR